jgi:transposase
MLKWLKKLLGNHDLEACAFGFEHTGNYSYPLSIFLAKEGLKMYALPPAELKFSMGIKRGKTDPEDAKRIAVYVMKNHIDLEQSQPLSPELKDLQVLFPSEKQP